MSETSGDDLFLPYYQDDVDNLLLSEEESEVEGSGGLSLAKALLPLVESSSPAVMPWVCSTRYKTELCTSYSTTGFCKYAERCQFAHGLHELHVPFRHPKYKTELCRSYHSTGYCYYGSRCLFVHSISEQRPTLRRRRNVPCRTFRAFGICPFGTRCNFLHFERGEVNSNVDSSDAGEKTQSTPSPQLQPQSKDKEWKPRGALCQTFSSFGFCLYGTRCRFQHGLPSKIKIPEQIQGGSFSPELSPTSPFISTSACSTSSSPPSTSPFAIPPVEAHNAFTFSSQHLSNLLLPLVLHLQQMESSKAQEIWDNRAP
ncbi:cysteine three histidine 1 [Mastacembelus armatus]|uniref:cysteine three histidine 1 n=1 Tax=Mastacembelus armatus TaxID=205130 RepID=UPI000E465A0C|nr:mRNA decay activator protein ZFP36L2-like [Mastacembelus armatus]